MQYRTALPGARKRAWALGLASALVAALAASAPGLRGGVASASSHREAPLIAADPQHDNTDLYAFVSPDKPDTVTFVANWIPFEEPNGGPNFYPFAAGSHYDISIDNRGRGMPDITYRWTFSNQDNRGTGTFLNNNGPVTSLGDPHLLFKQTYTLQEIQGDQTTTLVSNGIAAPSDVGPASMPDYASLRSQAVSTFEGGQARTLAGQAADPFFLDLRVFFLLYGANLKETGHNTLAGFNVNTIVLQVPTSDVVLNGDRGRNPVIGIWSTTSKRTLKLTPGKATPTGDFVQVSRLGSPLINEVIVPAALKDAFNALPPSQDHTLAALVDRVRNPEVPKLVQSIYGIPAPAAPRNDLAEIFLTGICKTCGPIAADLNSQKMNQDVDAASFVPAEELRLNTSIAPTANPNRLGVLGGDAAGYPNGRRLNDDVVDIEVQALEGAGVGQLVIALAGGDGVDVPANPIASSFPYVALPNTGPVNEAATAAAAQGSGGQSPALGPTLGGLGSALAGLEHLLSPSAAPASHAATPSPGPVPSSPAAGHSSQGFLGGLLNLLGL
ncbi:MAG: DUF4331 domain-containing protein [Actinobacteria bacterium]|nr:MAG: DUF4331 domain-containing protein [Actinomycetota bacterium]